MAGAATKTDELVSTINITPLVDVVLVVLVGLMVAATDLAAQSIAVDLPQAATGADAPPRTLALTVDERGAVFLDGVAVSDDALRAAVRAAVAADPSVSAILAADGRVAHAHVVHVVDLLRQEKIVQFALQVEPEG